MEPSSSSRYPLSPPRVVRSLGGANCSSVGSVVDLLFVTGTLGGALLVAVTAALDELASENCNEVAARGDTPASRQEKEPEEK
ncbi:MAG: hypothetical protein RMJ98_04860 [Myxococcales bacterium]|nr:hypothetical protein [Polyangiaceae bacterium]MDW8248623.1 hypothetical protein [Myxococcales bacterium]